MYSALLAESNVVRQVVIAVLQSDCTVDLASGSNGVVVVPYPSKSLNTIKGCLYLTVPSPRGRSILLCEIAEGPLEAIIDRSIQDSMYAADVSKEPLYDDGVEDGQWGRI